MIIRRIHIDAFGPLRDFDCELYSGMNIIRGDNESGKTSLAMFIKFIFYGLSGRGSDDCPSERKKYVNWDTGTADGFVIAEANGKEYRIERRLSVTVRGISGKESVSESLTVTDTETGGRVASLEECPGEVLFGVPERVFVNTVFSGQANHGKIDGADTAAAVENMLFSADETVNVKKAAEKLDKFRRTLLHKNGAGGEIHSLRENISSLRSELDVSSMQASELIELESSAAANKKNEKEIVSSIERQENALMYFDAVCLCERGDDAAEADRIKDEAENELRRALSLCCDHARLSEGRKLYAAIEAERSTSAEFRSRISELEIGMAALYNPDAPGDPEGELRRFRADMKTAGRLLTCAVISTILAVICGGASAALYAFKNQLFLITLAITAIFAVLAGVFFIIRGKKFSRMKDICRLFDVQNELDLEREVDYEMSRRGEAEYLSRKIDTLRMSLEQSEERLETLETEANGVCASFEDCCMMDERPSYDTDTLDRLRAAIALAERRQVAAEGAKATYESAAAVSAAKWDRIPRDKLASAREFLRTAEKSNDFPENDEDAEVIRRELGFNKAKLDSCRKKNHAIEIELASKRAVCVSPAELWDKLNTSSEKLKLLTRDYDAAILAADTLAEAGENIRRGIIPRIIRLASKYFNEATDGRYESLGSGSTFRLNTVIDGHTRDSGFLSSGTEDLSYICLRLALAEEIFGETMPPLVFDECFAFMDPERTSAAIDIMARTKNQILLFTCRPENGVVPTMRLTRK